MFAPLLLAEVRAENRVAFVGVDIRALATVLHCKRESGEQWINFQVCLHVLTGYLHNRSGIYCMVLAVSKCHLCR